MPVSTRRLSLCLGWAFSLGICAGLASQARGDQFDAMRSKWRNYLIAGDGIPIGMGSRDSPGKLEDRARRAWGTMNTGGSRTCLWTSLPFDAGSTSSDVTRTFSELETMALAWATPGCPLHANTDLAAAVNGGMDWMVTHVYYPIAYEYDNWWDWEIGGPQAFNNAFALMYPTLTGAQVSSYCAAIDGHSPGGPANTYGWQTSTAIVDLGIVMAVRGILGGDGGRIATARANLERIFPDVTTGSGFYSDGSFVMHTRFAYTGAYGVILLNAVADMINLLDDSPWQVAEANKARVFRWVSDSFEPVIYGGAMMDMVRGRTLSRANQTEFTDGVRAISAIRQVARFAPPAVAEALNRFAGAPRLASGQFQFAGMDRVVALRKGFGVGVSMSSARIANYESIHHEDLHGWFTGDGMTYLYLGAGDTQFAGDFWPTVDPYHLPGTTVEMAPRAPGEGAGRTTSQSWVGGAQVSGSYGAAGMALANPLSPSLVARKSWFMFDNEVVCLGAGITCASGAEVDTTVEDRRLGIAPANRLTVDGAVFPPAAGWSRPLGNVSWCALEGVGGYYFPGGATDLRAAFATGSGAWSDISGGPASPASTDNYLKLWYDHGVDPSGATYAYVLLPNKDAAGVAAYASSPGVVVLANTPAVQAAKKASLGVEAANFWSGGTHSVDLITANAPSCIVTSWSPSSLAVGISDPTQADAGSITVRLGRPAAALVSADPGVIVEQLAPDVVLKVDVSGSLGRTFQASFTLDPLRGR
jgi:hyaluronate lyase